MIGNSSNYYEEGIAWWERGDLDKAIAIEPEDASMINSRGAVLLDLKQPAKALEDFNEAIRLNSLLGIAFANRADAKRALGDNAGADADARQARQLGVR